jgi:hypothetical protein
MPSARLAHRQILQAVPLKSTVSAVPYPCARERLGQCTLTALTATGPGTRVSPRRRGSRMVRAREAKAAGGFFFQQAVRAMEDVLPDEIVSLSQSGEMTARSAVQEVMLKWSAQQRASARNTRAGIIFRMGDPPILGIVEIEELWSRPEFKEGDDTSRTVTIWIVMDESGDCEVATDKDVAVDRWDDEFLQEDIKGPPERRFVKLNVTMLAPLVTDVEVDVTVPEGQTGEFD